MASALKSQPRPIPVAKGKLLRSVCISDKKSRQSLFWNSRLWFGRSPSSSERVRNSSILKTWITSHQFPTMRFHGCDAWWHLRSEFTVWWIILMNSCPLLKLNSHRSTSILPCSLLESHHPCWVWKVMNHTTNSVYKYNELGLNKANIIRDIKWRQLFYQRFN